MPLGAREEPGLNVAVLSGGVGGARFVRGVVDVSGAAATAVVGNVGDDVEVLGLHVSPDLDSILYALAGVADERRGWGRSDETWRVLEVVGALGGEDWFALGDLDLGLHLVRTQALRAGEPLSGLTPRLAAALGVEARLLPATDDRLRTWLETPAGTFPFQEWFVARGHRDEVDAVRFEGEDEARPAPGVVEAIAAADLILLAPSNPYVSIGPILAVRELHDALARRRVPCVAVSPLIGGRAVKGPADRMLRRLAGGTSPRHVAGCYPGLIDALVVDEADADDLDGLGDVRPIVTRTLMSDGDARRRLVEAGDEVVIGSRDAERAQEKAREVGAAGGAANEDAVRGVELVVLATKADGALSTAAALAQPLGEVPLLSVASELQFGPAGARPGAAPRSLAERAQEIVDAPVVAGLHSLAAGKLAHGRPDEDAFVCGDDADAKALALELAAKVVSGRALDAGPLESARALEGLTAVIVNLNKRYKGHAGVRVTGLP